MHATTIASKSVAGGTPRAAVGTTHAAMSTTADQLEARLRFAREEYARSWSRSRRPQPVERRGDPLCKRPLSPVMLIATDATEHQDFEHSQLVERHSSSADARAHAGAQPGSKRQRASPLASRGELLAIQNSTYSLGFKLGFQALVQPPPTPAAARSGAAAFAPPPAPRFAADRPS